VWTIILMPTMDDSKRLSNRIFLVYLTGLGLLTLLLRLPFRSHAPFNWDSVNYALGVIDFNIIQHRPHPPGYILYVYLARWLNTWVVDPNASLVWVSILAGMLTVVFTFAFTYRRFNAGDALVSALLVITNPLIWFHDELALNYSIEAFFSIAIAYACYRAVEGSLRWAYLVAVFLGIAGGFRQTTMIILLPLAIFATWKFPWKQRLGMAALLGAICLSWGIPMIIQTGGLKAYLTASEQLSQIIEPQPFSYVLHALLYGGNIPLLLIVAAWLGLFKIESGLLKSWEKWFLLLWTLPGMAVISLRHIGQSGYILYLLPVIMIYTPSMIRSGLKALEKHWAVKSGRKSISFNARLVTLVITIVIIDFLAFIVGGYRLILVQDQRQQTAFEIASQYPPSQTIVLSGNEYDIGFRHISYYFPDYHVYCFGSTEVSGPYNVEKPEDVVLGWIFHSYQMQDNYSLDPSSSQFSTTLALPPNTMGILVTGHVLQEALENSADPLLHDPAHVIEINDWLTYIQLPEAVDQIIVENGALGTGDSGK